jgi:ABC-type Fe3+ transport system permease subunit
MRAGSGRERLAALLARDLSAVAAGVFAGAALVFIPAFGIFAIPDILGGTSGIMIGNVIKQQFLDTRDWPFGSVLSMVLTMFAVRLAARAWYARGEGRCMKRRSRWLWLAAILAYVFLYAPLVDRGGLFVQRLSTERPMGRLHARLVPQAVADEENADGGA